MRQPLLAISTAAASPRKTLPGLATVLFALATSLVSADQRVDAQLDRSTLRILPDRAHDRWRDSELVRIDLPLGFQASFDAAYSKHASFREVLTQRFSELAGPEIRGDRTLESRFALTRPLAPGIEFEIAWETRNSLAMSDPLGFGRQTLGARIRIAP